MVRGLGLTLSLPRDQVQPLVQELRSQKLGSVAKMKEKKSLDLNCQYLVSGFDVYIQKS